MPRKGSVLFNVVEYINIKISSESWSWLYMNAIIIADKLTNWKLEDVLIYSASNISLEEPNFNFFKRCISKFSLKWFHVFKRFETLTLSYLL